MQVDVYDSYAKNAQGEILHFDVFVPSGATADQAHGFGQDWLHSIGQEKSALEQRRCTFCHSEMANEAVQKAIADQGYFILQMENCPSPYWQK